MKFGSSTVLLLNCQIFKMENFVSAISFYTVYILKKPFFTKTDNMNQYSELAFAQLKTAAVENSKYFGTYRVALEQWAEIRRRKPDLIEAYVKAAYIQMSFKRFSQADSLCLEGMSKCAMPSYDLLACFANVKTKQLQYHEALKRWAEVRRLFPGKVEGYRQAAIIHRDLGQYDLADHMCLDGIEKSDQKIAMLQLYADLALEREEPEPEKLGKLINRRQEICNLFPDNITELVKLAYVYNWIAKYEPQYLSIYNNLVYVILSRYKGKKENKSFAHNRKRPGVCFLFDIIERLRYFGPVLKYINPVFIDIKIFIKTVNDNEIIKELGFELYNIKYDVENIEKYDYIVLNDVGSLLNDTLNLNKYNKYIFISHQIENTYPVENLPRNTMLVINAIGHEIYNSNTLSYQNFNTSNRNKYKNIAINDRCEITHTGLYHIDKFISCPEDKLIYKQRIIKYLDKKYDSNKPIIVLYDDTRNDFGQMIYCLNKLTKIANVIFKLWIVRDDALLSRLNPKVTVYDNYKWVNNDLRYGADFLLVGYRTGTLVSSLVLGLNVIPYYSRIEGIRGPTGSFKDHFKLVNRCDSAWAMNRRIFNYLKMFDLLDTDAISKAITGNEYLEWYHKMLSKLHKDIFTDLARPSGGGCCQTHCGIHYALCA